MIVNISEACAHLGYRSRSTVQRLIHKGHLDGYLRPGGGRAVLLETDFYRLPLTLSGSTIATAAGAVTAAAVASGALVAWRLRHLDLIAVLKTRE